MFWVILGVGAVIAAIVCWFLWMLLGWVGLTFGIIAFIGIAGVGWYAYLLYGKATDLMYEGGVIGKRLGSIAELLGQIRLPAEVTAEEAESEVAPARPRGDVPPRAGSTAARTARTRTRKKS